MNNITEDFKSFFKNTKNTRNPIFTFNDIKIGIIGDVHIGKTFRNGVPKDRLGERELMVLTQLEDLLNRETDVTVLVGDLFDKVRVSNKNLDTLIDIFEKACVGNPATKFYVLNGNHDMPKESDRISSFQLFEKYFNKYNSIDNLKIISKHSEDNFLFLDDVALYFSHYNAFQSLDEELTSIDICGDFKYRIAFGHWETIDFGSDNFIDRHVPKILLDTFNVIITGHEHKPKLTILEEDIPVITIGSMQPYAFGEELNSEKTFYVSTDIETVSKNLKTDINYYHNSYVRLLLDSSEDIPEHFNCLGRSHKKIKDEKSEKETIEKIDGNPVSFHKAFIDHLDNLKIENQNMKEYIENIEKVFIDKSYKE